MTKIDIRRQAKIVHAAREEVGKQELVLAEMVWEFLKPRGSMREMARQMGISPQYLCDIANGRRKVSDAVVGKLMEL